MGLTLRETKGSALTYAEMDANLVFLSSSLSSSATPTGSFTGSFTGSLSGSLTGSMTGSFTGSLQGTSSFSISSSFTVGGLKFTPSNSIIIPTTSSAPHWVGTEGEIKPVVSGSDVSLYAYLSGSWNQFKPSPKSVSLTITKEQLTGSLFTNGIEIGAGILGLSLGKGAKFYRDLNTITYNSDGAPFTASGTFRIREVTGASIVNTINLSELTQNGSYTHCLLHSDSYNVVGNSGVYVDTNAPITASLSGNNAYIKVTLFYDIIDVP